MYEALQRAERGVVRWVVRECAHEERERLERGELFIERRWLRTRNHASLLHNFFREDCKQQMAFRW